MSNSYDGPVGGAGWCGWKSVVARLLRGGAVSPESDKRLVDNVACSAAHWPVHASNWSQNRSPVMAARPFK